jgi:thymidylate kinase
MSHAALHSATAAAVLDEIAPGPVVIVGSLPPHARDLDIVVREGDRAAVEQGLRSAGFHPRGVRWGATPYRIWARFAGGGVDAVEVLPAAGFGASAPEVERLVADARPLDGYSNLRRPAPHDVLLVLGRRIAEGGDLPASKRRRAEAALAEDPGALARAAALAPAWSLSAAIGELERALRDTGPEAPSGPPAVAARHPWIPERARAAWNSHKSLRGARLIAFSGLDGSGKSRQAEALAAALEVLGVPAVTLWTRLEWTTLWEGEAALARIASPVKAVLRRVARRRTPAAPPAPPAGERGWWQPAPSDAVSDLRARSAVLSHAWVVVVVLVHAAAQRRLVREHLRAGQVVICDRYVLDTAVHLRRVYGPYRRFCLQTRLLERLSPRPLRAYFLDVEASTAYRRKREQFGPQELAEQAQRYREDHRRLGYRRLDGERPADDLAATIGLDVWRALA